MEAMDGCMEEGVRIRWCRFLWRLLGVPGEGGLAGLRGEGPTGRRDG